MSTSVKTASKTTKIVKVSTKGSATAVVGAATAPSATVAAPTAAASTAATLSTATPLIISPLRISTMTVTADWGLPINLDRLYSQLKDYFVPIGYPAEGILKSEHNTAVYGACHKDLFTNRKATKKAFFNQDTLILRRRLGHGWKEVNMKLFGSGAIQMTGVPSQEFAVASVEWLLALIKQLPISPFTAAGVPAVTLVNVQLINTDYKLNYDIQQDNLNRIFIEEYNLFSMLEKTIYQGVNAKYFYNTVNKGTGVCRCPTFCKGKGSGSGVGDCKRITMSIFRTGTIIVTGARTMEQIHEAYHFLNRVFETHATAVLIKRV